MLTPGTYKATEKTILELRQSNSLGSLFQRPRTVESRLVALNEEFEIPATVSGYYYTTVPVDPFADPTQPDPVVRLS